MASLKLYLFGSPQIELDGSSVALGRRKSLALLIYLAVTTEEHSREKLTTLFWPEHEPRLARSYLRRELSAIRTSLGEKWLEISGQDVRLDPTADIWTDVSAFNKLLARVDEHHQTGGDCPDCIAFLAEAESLYHEPFLAGFTLPDSPAFDEWQFFQAEGLQRQLSETLQRLLGWHTRHGEYEEAIEYGRRWLALDSLHEPAHRELMKLYAWSGQQAAALRQYQECVRLLDEGLHISPDEETTALYETIRLRSLAPPIAADLQTEEAERTPLALATMLPVEPQEPEREAVPNNLTPLPTPLIGREQELADLDELLADSEKRLISIVGPGGMGKTRLALASAERFVEAVREPPVLFKDGVYFVPLVSLRDPDHIVPAVVKALDFPLETGELQRRTSRQQLLDYLRRRRLLLIMDNFEHLLDGAELLADILETAPEVQIIATSRERLHLQQEQVFAIQGLAFPDWETPEDAAEYNAVELFVHSAQRTQHDFRLQEEDLTYLTRICRLLEGMPLGIELAAAWVDMLSLADIAAEIKRNLDFLQTDVRDVPERHRSMRAVFDTSWHQMSPAERHIFPQLSVFRGGFTRKAAQALITTTEGSPPSLRLLGRLVDKSLLQYSQTRDRYQLHELLRQYGAALLAGDAQAQANMRDRHSDYYCAVLADRLSALKGPQQEEALARIEADLENVRAAWHWATQEFHIKQLRQAGECLGIFHAWQGRYQTGKALFRLAAEALKAANESESLSVLVMVQTWKSVFCLALGETEKAGLLVQQSLDLLNDSRLAALDTRSDRAFAYLRMGQCAARTDAVTAMNYFERSLALYDELDEPWGMARALASLSRAARSIADYPRAGRLGRESLDILRSLGDRRGMVMVLQRLSELARYERRTREAPILAQEAVDMAKEIGDRAILAVSLAQLGASISYVGELERALAILQESLELYEEIGDFTSPNVADVLFKLGFSSADLGQYHQARHYGERALAVARSSGDEAAVGYALYLLGAILLIEEAFDQAAVIFDEAIGAFETAKELAPLFWTLAYVALTESEMNNRPEAHRLLFNALSNAVRLGETMSLEAILPLIALMLSQWGYDERAAALWMSVKARRPWVPNKAVAKALYASKLDELVAALPADAAAAARELAQQTEILQAAADLLEELPKLGWETGAVEHAS